jgi:hypothetical protein
VTQLYVLGPIEAFPARVLGVVHRLVGCDQASFNEIELRIGEYRVLVDPADNARSDAAPQFARSSMSTR